MAPSDRVKTTKAGARDDSFVVGEVNPDRAFVRGIVERLLAAAKAQVGLFR